MAARYKGLRLLACWDCGVRNSPGAWVSVACECCVLSGRGVWDELSSRPRCPTDFVCVSVSVIRCNINPVHLQRVGRKTSD